MLPVHKRRFPFFAISLGSEKICDFVSNGHVGKKPLRRVSKCQPSSAMLLDVHTPINPGSVFTNAVTVVVGGVVVTAIRARDAPGVKRDS